MLNNLKWILFVYLFLCVFITYADVAGVCGDTSLRVEILDRKNDALRRFQLYGKKENEPEILLYVTKKGSYFFVRCIKDKQKKTLVLFQEVEGLDIGPEDTFGIFDTKTNKMLIEPKDWPMGNQKQIEKLLGRPPPFVNGRSGGFFCCFNGDY